MTHRAMGSDGVPIRAREVLSYFLQHPRAADTLEGVTRWRLQAMVIERTITEVGEALTWLVRQEFLRQRRSASTQPIFTLNQGRAAEAERFVTRSGT